MHIVERHTTYSKSPIQPHTSLFNTAANYLKQVEQIIDYCRIAIRFGSSMKNPDGRVLKHFSFGKPIGVDGNGNVTKTLRVILKDDVSKQIITAYPV